MKSILESLSVLAAATVASDQEPSVDKNDVSYSPSSSSDTTNNSRRTRVNPPPQPWGTELLDYLRLFYPRTWWGLAYNAKISPFVTIDWSPLVEGLIGLCLPWLISMACLVLLAGQQQHTALSSFSPLYLASPWACHCMWAPIGRPFRQLVQMGITNRQLRLQALPEAVDVMWELVDQNRAIRRRRYDLFLPANTTPYPVQQAILFVPGAAAPTLVYAPVAAQLANAGYIVVIPSMEPMRLAIDHLGAEWSSMQRILKRVERSWGGHPLQWILAGHSMGSFASMRFYVTVQNQKRRQLRRTISNKLFMWGTMYATPYCKSLQAVPDVDLLLIQGSHDVLLDMTAPFKDQFETHYLPQQYQKVVLNGGTHHGFSHYQSAIPPSTNKGDLSRKEQQAVACQRTIQFLQQQQ